jgi:radical SAM family uncharacterized protein/radical SAM-linked protein
MRHPYADFIAAVDRPARYLGGEYGAVHKPWDDAAARICLAFPNVYDIGMSHLGTKILYALLNQAPDLLCERAFAPWTDMEAELRQRGLPILSLESARPLADFDVIGVSLQYELTYTNILPLLDLGGIALHAAARADSAPLVLGGGPVATHPEPVSPFFDAFFIGDAEALLPDLCREWAGMRRAGRPRLDALAELASRYPLYVPALYETVVEPRTGAIVVERPRDPRAPLPVRRAMVPNLDAYPFPADGPVPWAEAVFDRAAVEIARGCTEGCRFCQAGMIYRPVRERSPEAIIATIEQSLEHGGHSEASLTCLSTADYSAVTPLVKELMSRLRARKVSLGVSSLRAYGLGEELLDELASVKATGLTFAPEAGTQRMRDVINKNVTEAHIRESSERVFKKGWSRLKLYFMIGQPTETDEDVRGVVETGVRMLAVGKREIGSAAEVTVSVSSHVPKPHTPFQWAAMDDLAELERKQRLLRDTAYLSKPKIKLKTHDRGISFVEGVMARGDRRVAAAIEHAWRDGARFDGWDELFDVERWQRAFAATGLELVRYLGTRPVGVRLPWSHIDVGLEDGFLEGEYRRALKDRLSPPCGKPAGALVHPTNLAEAEAEGRRLVCYDCGIACDLSAMKAERKDYLVQLGAVERPAPRVAEDRPARVPGQKPLPRTRIVQGEGNTYRLRYTKLGRAAFISHLDVNRLLARIFRRASLPLMYSQGFSPKPLLTFGPALSLGVPALAELVDVRLDVDLPAEAVHERLREVSPEGLTITQVDRLLPGAPGLGKLIASSDWLFMPRADGLRMDAARLDRLATTFMARTSASLERDGHKGYAARTVDARAYVSALAVVEGDEAGALALALDWVGPEDPLPVMLRARVAAGASFGGTVRPAELATILGLAGARIARLGLGFFLPSVPADLAASQPRA